MPLFLRRFGTIFSFLGGWIMCREVLNLAEERSGSALARLGNLWSILCTGFLLLLLFYWIWRERERGISVPFSSIARMFVDWLIGPKGICGSKKAVYSGSKGGDIRAYMASWKGVRRTILACNPTNDPLLATWRRVSSRIFVPWVWVYSKLFFLGFYSPVQMGCVFAFWVFG